MTDRCCGTCQHLGELLCDADPDDAYGSLHLCAWPTDKLPWSLRYGARERVSVYAAEGKDCACWVAKVTDDMLRKAGVSGWRRKEKTDA